MMRHGAGRQKNESQPIASVPGPDRRRAARAGGDLALRQLIEDMGVETLMWGSNDPHPDGWGGSTA